MKILNKYQNLTKIIEGRKAGFRAAVLFRQKKTDFFAGEEFMILPQGSGGLGGRIFSGKPNDRLAIRFHYQYG